MFGNAQSTSAVTSSIDFSPVIQFGSDQNSTQDKVNHQVQSVSPKQDNSATASVGVGVGGQGSGGAVAKHQLERDAQPTGTAEISTGMQLPNKNLLLIGAGVAGLAGIYFFTKKK